MVRTAYSVNRRPPPTVVANRLVQHFVTQCQISDSGTGGERNGTHDGRGVQHPGATFATVLPELGLAEQRGDSAESQRQGDWLTEPPRFGDCRASELRRAARGAGLSAGIAGGGC